MFSANTLIDKLNTLISSGSLTEEQLLQAFGAIESLETKGVVMVDYDYNLPSASLNEGLFVYIISTKKYTYSNGVTWDIRNTIQPFDVNLYVWGSGSQGRLGDNTVTTKSSPVSISGSFTDWTQVSLGNAHTLGLRANGTAWAWGYALTGRLGDGTIINKSSPVSVIGGFTDWVQVSAGDAHSTGVRANGTAWAWGSNLTGRLGDGTAVSRSSPVSVVGGFTDWVQISAGTGHTLGLRGNGTAWGWGVNTNGRLGDNAATLSRSSPVSVVGGFTDWVQVSAGDAHSTGVRANGTAWAWGSNLTGRLGDGTAVSRSSPVSVVGGFTDWVQISAGTGHTLGLRGNGTAWGWGVNTNGRLGDNAATLSRSSPVSVVGGFTDWVQVQACVSSSIGVRANGTAWTWGSSAAGQLGDGTSVSKSSPVSIIGGIVDWVQVGGGSIHIGGVVR